jgi:hypothetical protein
VRDTCGVGGGERGRDLRSDERRRGRRHRTVLADDLGEASCRYALAHDPQLLGLLDDVEDRHEVWMAHRAGGARTACGVGRMLLQGDIAAEDLVERPARRARTAVTERLLQPVPPCDQSVLGGAVDHSLTHAHSP